MKIGIVVALSALLLLIGSVVVKGGTQGTPFQTLLDAITNLQEQIDDIQPTHGAGDVAFIHNFKALKTDGTAWRHASAFASTSPMEVFWHREPDFDSPIQVSDIVQWEFGMLLATSGDLWVRAKACGGCEPEWHNFGTPELP